MAYMNQDKKKVIAQALKNVVPANWKYGLSVLNHSTISFTLRQAPVNVLEFFKEQQPHYTGHYLQVNGYYLENQFEGEVLEIFKKIKQALNCADNYDNSDVQSDYFDVGYYVNINVGSWNKPFEMSV